MNYKIIIASLAGAITLFIFGYLIWGIFLGSYFNANDIYYEGIAKTEPSLLGLFISNLLWAFLLAFIFDKWALIRKFGAGFLAAMLIGLLIHSGIEFSATATQNLYKHINPVVVDVLVETARMSLAGGIIGLALGMMSKHESIKHAN
jgi:hypothetical protein